jgi:hypothetical protein
VECGWGKLQRGKKRTDRVGWALSEEQQIIGFDFSVDETLAHEIDDGGCQGEKGAAGRVVAPDREPKICGSDRAIGVLREEKEIIGLDVSVDDPLGVALGDESQDTADDESHPLFRERPLLDAVQDPTPLAQFHHHVDAVGILIHILHTSLRLLLRSSSACHAMTLSPSSAHRISCGCCCRYPHTQSADQTSISIAVKQGLSRHAPLPFYHQSNIMWMLSMSS